MRLLSALAAIVVLAIVAMQVFSPGLLKGLIDRTVPTSSAQPTPVQAPQPQNSTVSQAPQQARVTGKVVANYADWLEQINGIWEGPTKEGVAQRYSFFFSPQTVILQEPFSDPVRLQIVASNEADDSVVLSAWDDSAASAAALPAVNPILVDLTTDQGLQLEKAGVDPDEYMKEAPENRVVLIDKKLESLKNSIQWAHTSEVGASQISERYAQAVDNVRQNGGSGAALQSSTQRYNEAQGKVGEIRDQINADQSKVDLLNALRAQLTDDAATQKYAQQQEAEAKKAAKKLSQVTLRRDWDNAHKGFGLTLFYAYSTVRLGYVRSLLEPEVADLIKATQQ